MTASFENEPYPGIKNTAFIMHKKGKRDLFIGTVDKDVGNDLWLSAETAIKIANWIIENVEGDND